MQDQIGGGRCSLCGSGGTNKTTCPLNTSARNPNLTTHPLAAKMASVKTSVQADRQARQQADRQARQRLARQQADRQARQQADRQARQQADRQARQQADRQARQQADRQARQPADRQARQPAQQVDENAIKINDMVFKVVCKNPSGSRALYQVLNLTTGKPFVLYRSNSEAGILRLCYIYYHMYYKGFDYVQSTAIHYLLQEFINKIDHTLPIDEDLECEGVWEGKNLKRVGDREAYPQGLSEYNGIPREIINPHLFAMTICDTILCNHKAAVEKYCEQHQSGIPEGIEDNPQLCKEVAYLLKSHTAKTPEGTTEYRLRHNAGYNVVKLYKDYLWEKFTLVRIDRDIASFNWKTVLDRCHEIQTSSLDRYVIKDNISGEVLQLIVMNYHYTDKEEREPLNNGKYKICIGALPVNVGITDVGTYANYYPSGIISYKPLEYTSQTPYLTTTACRGVYIFVGKHMDMLINGHMSEPSAE